MSSRKSGSRIDVALFAPSSALEPFVECYWASRWHLAGQAPHTMALLADPCVNVAFESGSSRLVGVQTRLWRRTLEGEGFVRAVKFRPGALRAFLPEPVCVFTDRVVALAHAWPEAQALEPTLLAGGEAGDDEALRALDAWLAGRLRAPVDRGVARAVALVRCVSQQRDMRSADELARRAGLSLRELQRLFRAYVGATPKQVIRRVRLQEAARRLEDGEALSLAALAAELGYSDHAHLTRDFSDATGQRPSRFERDVHR